MWKLTYLRDHNHGIRTLGDLDGIRSILQALNLHVEDSRTNLATIQIGLLKSASTTKIEETRISLLRFSLFLSLFLSKFSQDPYLAFEAKYVPIQKVSQPSRLIKHSARSSILSIVSSQKNH